MTKNRKSLAERAKAFLAKHGAKDEAPNIAAVTELLSDTLRYRDKIRTLEAGDTPYKPDARVADLERELADSEAEVERLSLLIPAAGTKVLTADEIKELDAFRALGKPDDLKKQLDELPTLRTKVADTETAGAASKAATSLGWNPEATVGLINDKKLVLSFVAAKDAKGADIQVPHVRPAADEKAAPTPLADWQKANAGYMAAALAAKGTTPTPERQMVPLPITSTGTTPASTGDPVADFAKRSQDARNARPNPLIPRPAAAAT